ncbi:MAG: hypothetical protein IPL46_17570 [Saprospiraceae bacterium]|nr:hypothetical protein [Saprospiraceae bacterium]
MVDQHIQQLLTEGSDLIHFAANEVQRSEEDVVTFLACNNIKRGISHYLQAFIESHRMMPPRNPSPDSLLRICMSIDPQFNIIDFKALECSHEKGANNYCLDLDHVNECLELAKATRSLVIDRIRT